MWYWHKDRHISQWVEQRESRKKSSYLWSTEFLPGGQDHSMEKVIFLTNSAGQLDIHMQKNEVGGPLPHKQKAIKWIKDLNVRPKTIRKHGCKPSSLWIKQ